MTGKKSILAVVIATCAVLLQQGSARAACSLGGASVAFGAYDSLVLQPFDTIGSMVFRCNQKDHSVMITLSRGSGTSYATRRMLNGGQQLFYNLYRDVGRTIIWGDGSGGTQAYLISNPQPNNRDITVPIFGRIPAGQNVRIGDYTDTITITLMF